jgi:predicted negative regulator of RcsB-dependent stress response
MTESRRPRRDGTPNNNAGGRGSKPPTRGSKPGDSRGSKPGDSRGSKPTDSRGGKPAGEGRGRRSDDSWGSKPKNTDPRGRGGKPDTRGGKPAGRGRPVDRRQIEGDRTAAQQVYDGPPIPDDIAATDLDKHARAALQGLPDKLADKVARHLVMAAILIDDDPQTAHQHALAARARATRTGIVREACGETAYAAGKWAEALSEFRAARRMNGSYAYTPMMADCERALGRPDKALTYDTPENRSHLDDAGNIELTIVIAGARRDRGQTDAALHLLETEPLHTKGRHDWVPRLRYAYADTLHAAGRTPEAIEWFHRTIATDPHHTTDAHQRLTQLDPTHQTTQPE